jgi:hypothetical protein
MIADDGLFKDGANQLELFLVTDSGRGLQRLRV